MARLGKREKELLERIREMQPAGYHQFVTSRWDAKAFQGLERKGAVVVVRQASEHVHGLYQVKA
jgi:hypothetical protein